MRILVVENEKDLANTLSSSLSQNGYAVDASENGTEALRSLSINDYDLLLLELNLPDMDGLEICKLSRIENPSMFILILTERGKKEDIIAGLNAGADDYLVKPFHFQELLARIGALFRRDLQAREPILTIQDISLDLVEKEVRRLDQEIQLTRKEFGILEYLIRHPNEVVSQETLLEHVWGSLSNVFTNTVRVHIQTLRRKLGDNSKTPKYIETVIGLGYRFISHGNNQENSS